MVAEPLLASDANQRRLSRQTDAHVTQHLTEGIKCHTSLDGHHSRFIRDEIVYSGVPLPNLLLDGLLIRIENCSNVFVSSK